MSLQMMSSKVLPHRLSLSRPVSLKRIAGFGRLELADEMLVRRLKPKTLPTGCTITDTDSGAWVILEGWCARIRMLSDGRRQIIALILPGDGVNVCEDRWAGDRLPVVALTPVIAADAEPLRSALKQNPVAHPGLAKACERATRHEQIYCLNGLVRLGQQTAYERLAHLLLEVRDRLANVDLVNGSSFQLPVTQDVIANTLGLSLVHLSRTLRQMRGAGVIALRPGHIDILKPDVVASAACFPHIEFS